MGDITVQRGTNDVGNTGGTDTGFTAVSALTAAFEYNSNNFPTHGGSTSSGANMEGDDMSGHIELTGTGTLTFTRQSGSLAQNMRYDWQLVEYTGAASGSAEFVVRSRNTVAIGSGSASNTATLDTTPTNIDKCVPFITGVLTTDTANGGDDLKAIAYINDSGSLVVERGSSPTFTTTVQVVVVEFTGSDWEVYHGTATSAADTGSITLNTDSDGVGGSTGDVTDWGTAFIEGSFTSADEGLDSIAAEYDPGAGTTTVGWVFDSGNSSSHEHFVHVVRHPDMVVTRFTNTSNTAGDSNVDITSAGLTALDEAMVIGYVSGSGGGTAYGRNWRNYRLTSLTNAQHYCHRSGNTLNHAIQVIDFSGVSSGGGAFSLTAESGNFTVAGTAADLILGAALDSESANYSLSGTDAALLSGYALDAETGAFIYSGTDAALLQSAVMPADTVGFTYTGTDATLFSGVSLDAETGSYALTGAQAGLLAGYSLDSESGAFTLTGTDADLTAVSSGYTLSADPGSYVLSGTDVTFTATVLDCSGNVLFEFFWGPAEEATSYSGGFLSLRDQQIIAARQEDELLLQLIPAFLDALTGEVH